MQLVVSNLKPFIPAFPALNVFYVSCCYRSNKKEEEDYDTTPFRHDRVFTSIIMNTTNCGWQFLLNSSNDNLITCFPCFLLCVGILERNIFSTRKEEVLNIICAKIWLMCFISNQPFREGVVFRNSCNTHDISSI